MALMDFLKGLSWPATLQLAGVRIAAAAFVWPVVMAVFGNVSGPGEFLGLVVVWAIGLAAMVLIAIPAVALSRVGVPVVGVAALPAWLLVVGNPLVLILRKVKPELVPVDDFTLLTPPVLAVHGVPSEAAIPDRYQTADRQAPAPSAAAEQDVLESSNDETAQETETTRGDGNTYKALKAAIEAGSITAIEAVLPAGSDRLSKADLTHALCTAIDSDRLDIARRLVSAGADPNGYHAWTKSQWASLDRGVDASELGDEFGPPLFHAARSENVAAIDLLIDAGADVNLQLDTIGSFGSALDLALSLGPRQAVIRLHEHGAALGPGSLVRALNRKKNRREMVEWALDHGAVWTAKGQSILHSAVNKHDPDLLQGLLDRDYRDTQPDQFGATALQKAETALSGLRAKDAKELNPDWLPNAERVVQILSEHHRTLGTQ